MRLILSVMTCVFLAASTAFGGVFTIPEAKLLSAEFAAAEWGGTINRTDAAGSAARFDFFGLGAGSAGVEDDYPLDTVYGQILPSHANGDFSNFEGYCLWIQNVGQATVSVSLYLNTGFNGPSGIPSNTLENDTFWQNQWVNLAPNQAGTLFLDFDWAIPYHVEDNPLPHTQGGMDGVPMAINAYDRSELDTIGFQVFANGDPTASLLVGPGDMAEVPEPGTILLFAVGIAATAGRARRSRKQA